MTSIEELENMEERYRLILENQNDLIYIVNLRLEIEYINETVFKQLLGYTMDDLKDNDILFAVHPDDKKSALRAIREGIKNGKGTVDLRIRDNNGDYHFHEFTGKLFTDFDGIQKALIISREITEKKEFEIKLKQSEEQYRLITENANDLIGILNKDFILEFVNEQTCFSILGYKFDEVVGKSILDFVHPSDKEKGLKSLIKAKNEKEGIIEIRVKHKNGNYLWFEVTGKVYIEDNNELKGILVCRDITSRKKAELELKESEGKYRLITENANDLIGILNKNFIFEFVNDQATFNILGYKSSEVVGKSVLDFLHPSDKDKGLKSLLKVLHEEQWIQEIRLKHKNGTYIWLEVKGKVFVDNDGENKGILIGRDIIFRKESELILQESEEKFRSLVETTSDWIWEVDKNGIYTYSNPKVKEILGYEVSEILGKKPFDLMPSDEAIRVSQVFQRAKEIQEPIEIIKNKNIHKYGNIKTLETSGVPFFDENGEIIGFRGIDRDITERIKIEKEISDLAKFPSENPNPVIRVDKEKILYINQSGKNLFNTTDGGEIPILLETMVNEVFDESITKYFEIEIDDKVYSFDIAPIQKEGYINIYGKDITERKNSEIALNIEKKFTEDLINASNDTIFVFNPQTGKAIRWNKAFTKVSGYTDEEISSIKAPDSYYNEEDLERAAEATKNVISGGSTKVEMSLITKHNKTIPFEYSATLIEDIEGNLLIVSIGRDISERKRFEQELKESEEKFRNITEQSLVGISVLQDGVFKYFNEIVSEINGYSANEIINWAPNEYAKLFHPEDREFVMEQARKKQSGDTGVIPHYKYRLITKNGEIKWIEIYSKTINYEGYPADLTMTFDITDKIEAEQKLKESEERYRLITEASKAVVWTTDMNLNLTYISSNSPKILGYTIEESKSHPISLMMTPESLEKSSKILKEEFRNERKKDKELNRSRTYETDQIHKNGHIVPVEITFTFLRDENERAIGILGVSRNIYERKKAEHQLRDSELKFKDLYEEAPNSYFSIGPDKSVIRSNKAAERLLGYSTKELLEMKVFDLYADNEYGLVRAKELFKKFLEGDTIHDVELQMKTKKGEIRWVSVSVKPIIDEEGKVIESRSMILDINERKKAQEELKQSFEKLKELEYIINNSPSIVFLWKNAEGWPVEYVSENVKQFGYTPEDFYSGKVIYSEIIHPDDKDRVANEVQQHTNEDTSEFEQEYRLLTKSGEIRWIDDRTWIRRDLNRNATHFQGIVLDITDRKNASEALRDSEMKYREAYDMANFYKDLFTHDMNNILQIINSSTEIIGFQLGESEKSIFIENMTRMIQSQVDRGSKLISDVRTLTELDEQEITTKKINISKFLKFSIDFVKKAYTEKKITIFTENLDHKYYTNANELLQDVFDNILINGVKYNENVDVIISIKISKQIIEGKSYFKIEFIDNGIGVPDNRKKVVFKRGNRALKGSKGMGIGLSLVKKILNIFKGQIWVEDTFKGDYTKGSNFIVLLPEVA